MWVVDSRQMAALDTATIQELGLPAAVLMERAAMGVVDTIRARHSEPGRAAVLIGPGNNGGDGSAIARILHGLGWRVTIILACEPRRLDGDAKRNFEIARKLLIEVVDSSDIVIDGVLHAADIWVDALLGIGLTEAPRGPVGDLIRHAAATAETATAKVYAVDVPSGLDADTGDCPGDILRADVTVTFAHRKWGHCLPPGSFFSGEVVVADIGIPREYAASTVGLARWIDRDAVAQLWIPIPSIAHKGDLGHVLVIGGSDATPGAAILAGDAALHSGAGSVTVAGSKWMRLSVVSHRPELMTLDRDELENGIPQRFDTIIFGPGLGTSDAASALLHALLDTAGDRPVVIDADGLTLLAACERTDLPAHVILTPHPGELGRLLGTSTADVLHDLSAAAQEAADKYGAAVIAKTAGAVIVSNGIGVLGGGDAGMATAGSGDVLAGIVAALAARYPTRDAAWIGAWLHATAGREAAARLTSPSMIASDIIRALPKAFAALQG